LGPAAKPNAPLESEKKRIRRAEWQAVGFER
uniref:RNA-binding S4 domain-containing protein n=2 Tax=Bursaphelenchus xylophilus TaxID=6326 RepID=A0A1I7SPS8_BURXY